MRGDLIRSSPSRSFPDIAGDLVGTQTYTYDPVTQTGVFQVVNAPHLISLGPSPNDMFQMLPEHDGTLTQSLQMKLDRHGRLINSPANTFEIRGTVVIGDQTYQGVLLKGTPTAFGAVLPDDSRAASKTGEVFDLNMKITEGKLKEAFGSEAYLRITPQAGSTFDGRFTIDFSSEKPLTNLRASALGLARGGSRAFRLDHFPFDRRGCARLPRAAPIHRAAPGGDPKAKRHFPRQHRRSNEHTPGFEISPPASDAESLPSASFSICRTRSRVSPSDSPISLSVFGGASFRPNRIRRTVASRLSISSRRSSTSRRLSASTITTSGVRLRSSISISPRLQPFSGWSVCGTRLYTLIAFLTMASFFLGSSSALAISSTVAGRPSVSCRSEAIRRHLNKQLDHVGRECGSAWRY